MATVTPTDLTFQGLVDKGDGVNFSADDVIDVSGMKCEDLIILIESAAEEGEKSLELTFEAGEGTNAVSDKTFTIAPTEKKIISGVEAARFLNSDGKIDVAAALSSTGTGGALADYTAFVYNAKS